MTRWHRFFFRRAALCRARCPLRSLAAPPHDSAPSWSMVVGLPPSCGNCTPSHELVLSHLAIVNSIAGRAWRRGAPRIGWTRSCTPERGRRKACSGRNLRNYTLVGVNMTRWRRWDKGASGATQMMQCAQAAQGWGHACELRGTTYFIYLGCFMQVLYVVYTPFEHSLAHGHSVAP